MEVVQIICKCKDCDYSEENNNNTWYCYYWDYEQGMSPNTVNGSDFCSNGILKNK